MTQDETSIPPTIRRLWGLEPEKAPRTGLSVERVVQAAIDVADIEGLDAVTMSRVAKQLGFTTMALYRHVASKEELLELMRDAAADPPPEHLDAAGGWRARLEEWTWAMVRTIRRRPWFADLPVSSIPSGPRQLAWVEAGVRALRDTALTDLEKFNITVLLASHVRADAVLARELMRGLEQSGHQDWYEAERVWSRSVAAVMDPGRFPELSKMAASGLLATPESADEIDPDADFAFGLARILDGVEFLLDKRAKEGG